MVARTAGCRYTVPVAARKKAKASTGIVVIAGTDDGLVRDQAAAAFRAMAKDPDDPFANETIDGAAANSEEAFQRCRQAAEALQTVPFFGAKVVWLKGVTFLADTQTGGAERTLDGVEILRKVLEAGMPDGVGFLLSATAIDKRRGFWKFLDSHADVRLFDKVDTSREGWQDQVAAAVRRRAGELGLEFEEPALDLFVMLAGEATQQIDNELEKLDLYLGERRRVGEDDVRVMVPLSRAGVVFEIGNAIQHGHLGRALTLIDRQLDRGETAVGILRAAVIPTVRNLFMAAVLLESHRLPTGNYGAFTAAVEALPERDQAWLPRRKAGGVNVYPLYLAAAHAARIPLDRLRESLEACARADRDLVTTGRDPRLVLQQLVATLAVPAAPPAADAGGAAGRRTRPPRPAR